MVDKKACKVRKRKYQINGAIFITRLAVLFVVIGTLVTVFSKIGKSDLGKVLESSAYIEENGVSSMVKGVENGAVYTSAVTPVVAKSVENATLTKDGEKIKFRSGRKISEMGNYILTLKDKNGNVDTIYFDIEM